MLTTSFYTKYLLKSVNFIGLTNLNFMSVLNCDGFFNSCRYKYITRLVHETLAFVRLGTREPDNASVVQTVLFQLLLIVKEKCHKIKWVR